MPGDKPGRTDALHCDWRLCVEIGNLKSAGNRNDGSDFGSSFRLQPFFAGLVVIAGEFHPIPFRTRPLKPSAPMVLRLKTWESRSLPGLPRTVSPFSAALKCGPTPPFTSAYALTRFGGHTTAKIPAPLPQMLTMSLRVRVTCLVTIGGAPWYKCQAAYCSI